jgi:hypothetical protein
MDDRDLRELRTEIERLNARLAEVEDHQARRLKGLFSWAGSSPLLRLALVAGVVGLAAGAYAATISVPHTFANGTPADALEVNANFDALVAESNDQHARITAVENSASQHQNDASNPHSVTAWQAGAATLADISWGNLSGIPAGFADGVDD